MQKIVYHAFLVNIKPYLVSQYVTFVKRESIAMVLRVYVKIVKLENIYMITPPMPKIMIARVIVLNAMLVSRAYHLRMLALFVILAPGPQEVRQRVYHVLQDHI